MLVQEAASHQLIMWVGRIGLHALVTVLRLYRHCGVLILLFTPPLLDSNCFLLPDSTSTLAGPSPRAVQLPECRVQPLPVLAQLPMSTLLDPK